MLGKARKHGSYKSFRELYFRSGLGKHLRLFKVSKKKMSPILYKSGAEGFWWV